MDSGCVFPARLYLKALGVENLSGAEVLDQVDMGC